MTETASRPWPRVSWDEPSLQHVAQAVRKINPHVVHQNDESAADWIRGQSERELYRLNPEHGTLVSTGGWQVVFVASDQPNQYTAWPSVTGYTALRYAKEQEASK